MNLPWTPEFTWMVLTAMGCIVVGLVRLFARKHEPKFTGCEDCGYLTDSDCSNCPNEGKG